MTFIPFTSQEYLTDFTPLSKNIDVTEIFPHVESTELIYTREILGGDLYNDLKTKFIAQTLVDNEIELVNLLKQHIAYRSAAESLPFIATKIKNSGVVKLKGDNFDAASLKDIQYLQNTLETRAEYYETRVKEFICLYQSDFPLYKFSNTNLPNPSGDITGWDCGVYLGEGDDTIKMNRYYYGN